MAIQFREVSEDFGQLEPGTIASGSRLDVLSRTVIPSTPAGYTVFDIAPGQAVFQAPTHDEHATAQPGVGSFLGIAVNDGGLVPNPMVPSNGRPTYAPGDNVAILRKGEILVIAGSNVSAGDPAYVGSGAALGVAAGVLTNRPDGNIAIRASWAEAAKIGSFAKLKVSAGNA